MRKVSSAFLMAVALVSTDDRYDSLFLNNYAQINLVNQLGSIAGCRRIAACVAAGLLDARVGESRTSMTTLRLERHRHQHCDPGAEPAESRPARSARPHRRKGTDFQYAVSAPGRLTDPSQFEDIVIRSQPDASLLARSRCRARGTRRAELWQLQPVEWPPSGNVIIFLSPGANAVRDGRRGSSSSWRKPSGPSRPASTTSIPYDSTMFVRTAISDVVKTLLEAVVLVILVVFIFLQSWRATLIPLLTVPVAVIGTFALFPLLGFSINITSMFGLVLAIGIVVDDAIVVVEAVQRHIDEGMSPRDATIAP